MRYALLLTVALLLVYQHQAHAGQAVPAPIHNLPVNKKMSQQYIKVTQQLETFKANHDVKAMSLAISMASAAPDDTLPTLAPTQMQSPPQDKLSLWLAIFEALDAEINPDFDLAKVPQLTVAPPPESGLPAGVAPASIKDPSVRKAYNESIAANDLQNQRYQYQYALSKEEERAEVEVKDFIASAYLPYPAQLATLKNRIVHAQLKPSRQKKLEALLLRAEK